MTTTLNTTMDARGRVAAIRQQRQNRNQQPKESQRIWAKRHDLKAALCDYHFYVECEVNPHYIRQQRQVVIEALRRLSEAKRKEV